MKDKTLQMDASKARAGRGTPMPRPPRIGYLGVGWIGRHRLEAIQAEGLTELAAVADTDGGLAGRVGRELGAGAVCGGLEELLELGLDGVVIATPSALHASQALAALERGVAVFCQKPLGRNGEETRAVIAAARRADRLLGVDLSYRHVAGVETMRELIQSGRLGRIFAAELVFHNAYGPDKPWYYERELAGGGCLIDLGIHLADLALWLLGAEAVRDVRGRVLAGGEPLAAGDSRVEDYAAAEFETEAGVQVRLACSWRLAAGQDCVIAADIHGTQGGVSLRNVSGSFFDFTADWLVATSRQRLASPPDPWGGRAAAAWARRLAAGGRFDPELERLAVTADLLDRIYADGEARAGGERK